MELIKSPIYSICMCNKNMSHTLDRSISSIAAQLDEKFEIVVVDDASTDDSRGVLRKMQSKFSIIRTIFLPYSRSRKLGYTRNISVQNARGKYVLLQLDCDDVYSNHIKSFIDIFHTIECCLGYDYYLKGNNINMASKDFLISYGPYKNIFRGEDRDFWARLAADGKIVWLKHDDISVRLKKTSLDLLYRKVYYTWDRVLSNFKVGITLSSYYRYISSVYPLWSRIYLYEMVILLPAFIVGRMFREKCLPKIMRDYSAFNNWIISNKITLSEFVVNNNCDFEISDFLDDTYDVYWYADSVDSKFWLSNDHKK